MGKEIIQSEDHQEKSSGGLSPFVQNQLAGYDQFGFWLSDTLAFWLWEKSDTVGHAVDKISWAFQSITPALRDKHTGEIINRSSDHPFLELLSSPGFLMDSAQLKYALMTSFLVTGNCFPILQGNVNYEPIGIHTLSANKANLQPDGNNFLYTINFTQNEDPQLYRRQMIPKRKTAVFQAENMLSETIQLLIKKRRWGIQAQSPLERIYYQTITKYYGHIHNAGIMKNASRPGGMFSPGDGPMSQTQYESFQQEIETKFSGPSNAGRNIVAPRPVKYENLLLNTRDMDFINLIENSKDSIYNMYDIPLAMVSKETMTNANFTESQTAFYDQAVLPRATFLLKRLGDFALPRYKDGDRYELIVDEKQLPALKARMFDRAESMRNVGAFSDNEIRTEAGYESLGADGDIVYKPANLVSGEQDDDYTLDNRKPADGSKPKDPKPKPAPKKPTTTKPKD